MREIAVFGGSAHPALTAEICAFLSVPQQAVRLTRFANDCLEVQLQANCRERDVFIIQPLIPPVQENLVELLLMADAARGASAARVTAVMPHYAYARSDKKDEPRISIGGRLVADLLVTAGVNRVLTLTLHSPQVHGFFSVPVDHLHALREIAAHFRGRDLSRAVVVSPDLGYAKSAAAFARRLGVPVAAGAKQRISDLKVIISAIIGDVAGRDVIILDDEIARGTTVFELLTLLRESIGLQPSPGVTSASRALAYCWSRARQPCPVLLVPGLPLALQVGRAGGLHDGVQVRGPRLHPPRPRTASPCPDKTGARPT